MSDHHTLRRLNRARRGLVRLRTRVAGLHASRVHESGGLTISATLSESERDVVERARTYTMTSTERIVAVADAVEYVIRRRVPGAFVECGVWRGGSVLAMILTLQRMGASDRDVYLFDTFEGMTAPTDFDTSAYEEPAVTTWRRAVAERQRGWEWAFGEQVYGLDQVRHLLQSTGYPPDRVHYIVGPVEETLPAGAPDEVALLRLDTDWYESTRHELVHLYPRLAPGGALIIDDYGHWQGARRAVDEYFSESASPLLFSRIDYTGRMGVKW
ncbi:MAG: TylF/MycF/NovP-related O-methyltransferase [Acidimicrobiales bacterium]